ncbi:MAG: hypothetical protein J7L07_02810 [Candidatus Odinarchaeota archaeon]|nr:hypothetical protein [Candidatus Odinarchaeota archaeon]
MAKKYTVSAVINVTFKIDKTVDRLEDAVGAVQDILYNDIFNLICKDDFCTEVKYAELEYIHIVRDFDSEVECHED